MLNVHGTNTICTLKIPEFSKVSRICFQNFHAIIAIRSRYVPHEKNTKNTNLVQASKICSYIEFQIFMTHYIEHYTI